MSRPTNPVYEAYNKALIQTALMSFCLGLCAGLAISALVILYLTDTP